MAIAPSKLGRFIRKAHSDDEILRMLRRSNLVNAEALDEEVISAIRKAWEENASLGEGDRP